MAKKIQAWTEFGPRLASTDPVTAEEVIEQLIQATNQTRGSILAVLSELDVVIQQGLKAGRSVRLPDGTRYRPYGKKDGSISVSVQLPSRSLNRINTEFRGKWINAENIGKDEAEIIAMWNAAHPGDPIEE